ncbi:hypothetical protein HDU76_011590 [Blyttiomyces sp. JEL0837]|nr:hypothetical protein HDU76_011590 [Blyttiomyces sp. JEL0837]
MKKRLAKEKSESKWLPVPIDQAWRSFLSQEAKDSADFSQNARLITSLLEQFLTSGAESQMIALRRLGQITSEIRAVGTLDHHTEGIIQKSLIPIIIRAYFAAPDPQCRNVILSVLSKVQDMRFSSEVENGVTKTVSSQMMKDFESMYLDFLQSNLKETPMSAKRAAHLCSVMTATVDWSAGRTMLASTYASSIKSISSLLEGAVKDVFAADSKSCSQTSSDASSRDTSSLLVLNSKVKVCQDITKIIVTLVSKLHSLSMEKDKQNVDLLSLGVSMTFSDQTIFFRDCQFIAGILCAWMLEIGHSDVNWPDMIFGDEIGSKPLNQSFANLRNKYSSCLNLHTSEGDYSLLCFYRGILTVVSPIKLLTEIQRNGKPERLQFVIYDSIINIIGRSSESATRVLAFQTMASWLAALKNIVQFETPVNISSDILLKIFDTSFDYIFAFWEDPVDSIQHKLKDMFLFVLELLKVTVGKFIRKDEYKNFLSKVIECLMEADWQRKVKYDLLSYILTMVHPAEILEVKRDFLSICLRMLGICSFLARFFTAMHEKRGDQLPVDSAIWIPPLLEALCSESHSIRRAISDNLINHILEVNPEAFDLLLDEFRLHAIISVLRAGRNLALFDGEAFVTGKAKNYPLLEGGMLFDAMSHPDLNLRNDVCGLICETRRITAEPTSEELELFKSCIILNASIESSEFRQRLNGYAHKLLSRIRRCIYANRRDIQSRNSYLASQTQTDSTEEEKLKRECEEIQKKLDVKENFVSWLVDFASISLFPGSSHTRVACALEILKIVHEVEIITIDTMYTSAVNKDTQSALCTLNCFHGLISILLTDSYEQNKESAFKLLKVIRTDGLVGIGNDTIELLLHHGFSMIRRLRTSEAEAGSSIIRFIFSNFIEKGFHLRLHIIGSTQFMSTMLDLLEDHITRASETKLESLEEFPIHGVLIALKHIIQELQFPAFQESSPSCLQLQADCKRTLMLSTRACNLVHDLLSNSSPEGNLPDFDNEEGVDYQIMGETTGDRERQSKSQMILHECFRTLKEACSVQSALLSRLPYPISSSHLSYVSFDLVKECGTQLQNLLVSVRHRGAFSGVYASFQSVCLWLLSSNVDFLADLPRVWLDDFIGQIDAIDISITRRSGGLPLGIVAILAVPSPSRRLLLSQTMQKMFELAKQETLSDTITNLDLPQVHAYNIIRQLIQEGTLSEIMHEYICDAFILCLNGFKSSVFPIRNCATMLFSTLKTRDDEDGVNTVTGREFFTRYPQLHPFLLSQLKDALINIHGDEKTISPTLFPVLTILSRLKPYSAEGLSTHLGLGVYRPLVQQSAVSPIYKVRILAGRALASLIAPSEAMEFTANLAKATDFRTQNHLHGTLVQIHSILKLHLFKDIVSKDILQDAQNALLAVLEDLIWVLGGSAPMCQDVYISIASDVLIQWRHTIWFNGATQHSSNLLYILLGKCLSQFETACDINNPAIHSLKRNLCQFVLSAFPILDDKQTLSKNVVTDCNLEPYRCLLHYIQVIYGSASMFTRLSLGSKLPTGDWAGMITETCDKMCQALKATSNTFLVVAFLPCLATLLSEMPTKSHILLESYLDICQHWAQHRALNARLAVVESYKIALKDFMTKKFGDVLYVKWLCQIDFLLVDIDNAVREEATKLVTSLLLGNIPLTADRSRWILSKHMIAAAESKEAKDFVVRYFVRSFEMNSTLENLLLTERKLDKVVFVMEDADSYKEHVMDAVFRVHVFTRMMGESGFKTIIEPELMLILQSMATKLKIANLSSLYTTYVSWKPSLFEVLFKAICILKIAQGSSISGFINNNEVAEQVSSISHSLGTLQVHPVLAAIIREDQKTWLCLLQSFPTI